jgi:hypothetical protein
VAQRVNRTIHTYLAVMGSSWMLPFDSCAVSWNTEHNDERVSQERQRGTSPGVCTYTSLYMMKTGSIVT